MGSPPNWASALGPAKRSSPKRNNRFLKALFRGDIYGGYSQGLGFVLYCYKPIFGQNIVEGLAMRKFGGGFAQVGIGRPILGKDFAHERQKVFGIEAVALFEGGPGRDGGFEDDQLAPGPEDPVDLL